MTAILYITSGDLAGDLIAKSGIPGEVFVWHDILYDGPRYPGWPDEETLIARAAYLEAATGGGLSRAVILQTLRTQICEAENPAVHARGALVRCLFV